ncbi:phage tail protein [Pseudomonas sp. S75]|uniref:phage tail assembly chaperone n=1 Tax=unclassified Pseudomonas TaxID=196821 RepID=UPI0019067DC3|nr:MULTISPECIES: phage tail assembly chaperone [unclassified Pseudomonas]MBJ9977811.1 phage tail protein [Pseudomonas sp. S30]MBK0155408.1 phage tail protein [Pseudomonas sp. S75]
MKRFYSQSTGTTYLVGVHSHMPADAVPLPESVFLQVICNPEPDKVRDHDENGLPVLIDRPAPTLAERSARERAWRDARLQGDQWLVVRHTEEQALGLPTTLSADQYEALLHYRQALREWPASGSFPDESARPVAPDLPDSLEERP